MLSNWATLRARRTHPIRLPASISTHTHTGERSICVEICMVDEVCAPVRPPARTPACVYVIFIREWSALMPHEETGESFTVICPIKASPRYIFQTHTLQCVKLFNARDLAFASPERIAHTAQALGPKTYSMGLNSHCCHKGVKSLLMPRLAFAKLFAQQFGVKMETHTICASTGPPDIRTIYGQASLKIDACLRVLVFLRRPGAQLRFLSANLILRHTPASELWISLMANYRLSLSGSLCRPSVSGSWIFQSARTRMAVRVCVQCVFITCGNYPQNLIFPKLICVIHMFTKIIMCFYF